MITRQRMVGRLLLLSVLCTACVAPAIRVDEEAAAYGFERQTVRGTQFPHRVYLNTLKPRTGNLHVYIEGDGLPWLLPDLVSADPTPRTPLMLHLMAQDPNPAIYLGRPCYFGFAQMPPCNPWWWTEGRFSSAVVESMAAALARLMPRQQNTAVTLVGHSGGGALAMLLASRLLNITAVVTLAGNLDTEAWTRHHHYSDLSASLNPALMPRLDERITQLHFQGGKDQNIPPTLASGFAAHQPQAHFKIYPELSHSDGWEEKWPEILPLLAGLKRTVRAEPNN
jgi:pimeloyl-ACP methyl ester carboxylesterase